MLTLSTIYLGLATVAPCIDGSIIRRMARDLLVPGFMDTQYRSIIAFTRMYNVASIYSQRCIGSRY